MAIQSRGKSRQISGNFVLKTMAITFRKIATDRIAVGIPKNNGDHSGDEIVALFGMHLFGGRMTIFFSIQGVGGVWVMVCIPLSLYQIFYQIFLNLSQYFTTYKGVKVLKYDKIQNKLFVTLFTSGGAMV